MQLLATKGKSSLEATYSFLGRLFTFMLDHHPGVGLISGSHVREFRRTTVWSGMLKTGQKWAHDWLGLDVKARDPFAPTAQPEHPYHNRRKSDDQLPFTLHIVLGLEWLAAHHDSPFVRGHAAFWFFDAMAALRFEQASSVVLNAVVSHLYDGVEFQILCASVLKEKHPDDRKQRARPVWAVANGVREGAAALDALAAMLAGAETLATMMRDTDSSSGDPLGATRWINSAVIGATREDASLRALLRLDPIGLSAEAAARYHGHGAKRFMNCVANASPAFGPVQAKEVSRFSGSVAQDTDLMPSERMLRRHSIQAASIVDIYGNKAKVAEVFDLLAKFNLVVRDAARRSAQDSSTVQPEGGWSASGPFKPRALSQEPLLLRLAAGAM